MLDPTLYLSASEQKSVVMVKSIKFALKRPRPQRYEIVTSKPGGFDEGRIFDCVGNQSATKDIIGCLDNIPTIRSSLCFAIRPTMLGPNTVFRPSWSAILPNGIATVDIGLMSAMLPHEPRFLVPGTVSKASFQPRKTATSACIGSNSPYCSLTVPLG